MASSSPTHVRPAVLLRALRPWQWAKNLLVFFGAAGSGSLLDVGVLPRLGVLLVCFSALASGVYLFNDVRDAALDRLDPRKSGRPVAAGLLAPGFAVVSALVLWAVGLLGALLLDPLAALVLAFYLVSTLGYSWRLKHVPMLEVLLLAAGFVARAAACAVVARAPLGGWFLLLVASAAVFVVLVKRSGELREGRSRRPVLAAYGERGLLVARVTVLFVTLVLYTGWAASTGFSPAVVVSMLLLASGLLRVNASVVTGGAAAPDELVFRDPLLFAFAVGWFVSFALASA